VRDEQQKTQKHNFSVDLHRVDSLHVAMPRVSGL
jgi:hypothetical protein